MKSMLDQLQEAEEEKIRQKKIDEVFGETMEKIGQALEKMGVEDLEQVTSDKVLKAVTEMMRQDIYKQYPSADPKVIEALLLVYGNLFEDMSEEIGNEKDHTDAMSKSYIKEAQRFAKAMQKALKTMNS